MPLKYFIKTYGCQMNIVDSEKLAEILESAGYAAAESEPKADLLLVNTCVVRKNAADKAAWYVTSAKGLKKENPNLIIGLCGCLVKEPDRDVKAEFPHVDIFIDPHQPERLVEFLQLNSKLLPAGPPAGRTGRQGATLSSKPDNSITKYITIMTGCDNFCSYCVVPYVRGREFSRPITEILEEIKQLDLNQIKEIFLLGQNVNSYKYGLANLLREIELLVVSRKLLVNRIRFMTSHPRDMSDEIINAVAELPHVCEYFHLPIQHGDDKMLKEMNRGYDTAYYLKLVEKIRAKMPNAAITSDVIVGYPGETEQQFRNTLYIIEQVGFDACNTAAYSVRPGTAAAKLKDDVPEEIKQQRLQEAMRMVDTVTKKNNDKLVGSVQEILVDNPGSGRTRTNKIVKFANKNKDLLGQLVNVKIISAQSWVLKARLTADKEKGRNNG